MTKKSKRTRNTARSERPKNHVPMRGGLLSWLAASFRLRQATLKETEDVSEVTAKRSLMDERDTGHERHVALARSFVDHLFSAEYLSARGLDQRAATRHNDLVTQALEALLARREQIATVFNALPYELEPVKDWLGALSGYEMELPARVAAYAAVYGYMHDVIRDIPKWSKGPKLAPWWESVTRRAGRSILPSALYANGLLDGHTLRQLRDGESLPKESTIEHLARRLEEYEINRRFERGSQTAAEIEFELRVAVAVAENANIVERVVSPSRRGPENELWMLRAILLRADDRIGEDILLNGVNSRYWPAVRVQLEILLIGRIVEGLRARAAKIERLRDAKRNPERAAREEANEWAALADEYRRIDPRKGADGPEQREAELCELEGHRALVVATKGKHEPPPVRRELQSELEADNLCIQAAEPGLRDEEREARLREAVRVCDWSAYAHRSLGEYLQQRGRHEEAVIALRRALELNPAHEFGRVALVVLLGTLREAQGILALTKDDDDNPTLLASRAQSLFETGKLEDAESLLVKIRERHPRHPMTLRVSACCARARGDEREVREFERSAAFYELGVGYRSEFR